MDSVTASSGTPAPDTHTAAALTPETFDGLRSTEPYRLIAKAPYRGIYGRTRTERNRRKKRRAAWAQQRHARAKSQE